MKFWGIFMRKILQYILTSVFVLTSFGGCSNFGFLEKEKECTTTMKAHYDYGMHIENQATLLIEGCIIPFKIFVEYGITELVAGDIVHITHKGEMIILDVYPGRITSADIEITNVTVERANVIKLDVKKNEQGEIGVYYADCEIEIENEYVYNVINQDGTFERLSEKHIGEIIYATEMPKTSVIDVQALYSYYPRPLIGEHTHSLVVLDEEESTCQKEGYVIIGCTHCGWVYESRIIEKVACCLDENNVCIWCGK